MIISAGRNEIFDFATPVGVGLVESAIGLTKICLERNPKEILFIGSAGSYGTKNIFDIVVSNRASNVEISTLQNFSYSPLELHVQVDSPYVSCETICINSSNYITKSREFSRVHVAQGRELENMEFYSILEVAKRFSIPAFGVFVVSNFCYENAHDEFIQNHTKVKEILSETVLTKYKDLL